jgi:Caspase domain
MMNSKRALATGFLCVSLWLWGVPVAHGSAGPAFDSTPGRSSREAAAAPIKRALLIGINHYEWPAAVNREAPQSSSGRAHFTDLWGPKNDVRALKDLLTAKYGFEAKHITVLEDEQATREGILRALNDFLNAAATGDVCVFYYSGHGSRVKNTKGGEPDNYDESLVPADSRAGAKDIRDKELARIYIKAIKRGVRLTVIVDSCHSGSIGRGARQELARTLPFIEADVSEAPGFDAAQAPEKIGALILSAARDEQKAEEYEPDGILAHRRGKFSWALTEILQQPYISPNEPAERIFQRVSALMQARAFPHQPVMAGTEKRVKEPLFGGIPDHADERMTAAVSKVTGKIVQLQGGLAIGLSAGCELKELDTPAGKTPVRLTVTDTKGLSRCEARVTAGDEKSIEEGQLFVLDEWVPARRAMLTVWMPPAVGESELSRMAQQIQALRESGRVQVIDDPATQAAQYAIEYDAAGWRLLMPRSRVVSLGAQPMAAKILALLPEQEKASLFINLPPSQTLRGQIKLTGLIEVSDQVSRAQYALTGRAVGSRFEYAWVRPGVTDEEAKTRDEVLPVRSDWQAISNPASLAEAARALGNYAVTLCRVAGWLQLEAPLNVSKFPYRLALEKIGIGTIGKDEEGKEVIRCDDNDLKSKEGAGSLKREGSVVKGECYNLALVADRADLNAAVRRNGGVKRQFIYIFAIDSTGQAGLLYPAAQGNVENYFPIGSQNPPESVVKNPPERIVMPNTRISFQSPFGLDTYLLLASDEEISDPFVFNTQGVRTPGEETRKATRRSPLEDLIDDVNNGARAGPHKIPQNFSIDRMSLRSLDNH